MPTPPPSSQVLSEILVLANRLRRGSRSGETTRNSSPGVEAVLQILQQFGPQSVPQVARRRSTSRQNVQVAVNRLLKLGWVSLSANPAHKRSPLLELSAEGQLVAAQALDREAILVERLRSIPESDMAVTVDVLRRIRQLIDNLQPTVPTAKSVRPTTRRDSHEAKPVLPAEAKAEPDAELPVSLL